MDPERNKLDIQVLPPGMRRLKRHHKPGTCDDVTRTLPNPIVEPAIFREPDTNAEVILRCLSKESIATKSTPHILAQFLNERIWQYRDDFECVSPVYSCAYRAINKS